MSLYACLCLDIPGYNTIIYVRLYKSNNSDDVITANYYIISNSLQITSMCLRCKVYRHIT